MSIRIIVNGANGRMGQEAVKAIQATHDLQLVACTGRHENLAAVIKETKAEVVVDFTRPDCVYENTLTIIENHAHPVIGTTGLSASQIETLQAKCQQQQLGGIIAPNFSISAVLMMRVTAELARYLPQVEIIEMHHDKKLDAPSGTAIKTATMIAAARQQTPALPECKENLAGARGGLYENIPIHSIRLPGLVAHQEVIFGGDSETLTLRHDSIHRAGFMPGVLLSCRKAPQLKQLFYGLEHLL
jgi:4-hydroxy-tetrahydrodipicolinate reductase